MQSLGLQSFPPRRCTRSRRVRLSQTRRLLGEIPKSSAWFCSGYQIPGQSVRNRAADSRSERDSDVDAISFPTSVACFCLSKYPAFAASLSSKQLTATWIARCLTRPNAKPPPTPRASAITTTNNAHRFFMLPTVSCQCGRPRIESLYIPLFGDGRDWHGYVYKQNILLEYRWGEEKQERLPELAKELIHLKVDLIVTMSAPERQRRRHGNPSQGSGAGCSGAARDPPFTGTAEARRFP